MLLAAEGADCVKQSHAMTGDGVNDKRFRESTLDLIEAAQNRDHDAAKESARRLERSCIECHALINSQ